MKSSPLYFHFHMASFCQIISEQTNEKDMVVVDMLDTYGYLLNTPYLVAKSDLSNISLDHRLIKSKRLTIQKPDRLIYDLSYCGKHPIYDDIVITYSEISNEVFLCDILNFMAQEIINSDHYLKSTNM